MISIFLNFKIEILPSRAMKKLVGETWCTAHGCIYWGLYRSLRGSCIWQCLKQSVATKCEVLVANMC